MKTKTTALNKDIIAVYSEKGVMLDVEFTSNSRYYYDEALLSGFKADFGKALLYFRF